MPLGIALPLAENLLEDVRGIPLIQRAELAGSVRRARETIGDVDVLIISGDSAEALCRISALPAVRRVNALGDTRASFLIEGGIRVDVRAVPKECYGAALQYFTGSKQHNIHLRTLGRQSGLRINEYGIFRGRKRIGGETEEEVYRSLGMTMIPPELREDRGEVEAAREHKLPKLIELTDLRGDLHVHTDYSDGKSTVEEMVERAAELGYEYVALADHSPAARIAHGLERDRLEQKVAEVEHLRQRRRGKSPVILLGAEVDILADGALDYPDDILARLDVVTASVHAVFRQSKDRMTGRLLDAMSNRHVHILGHPSARLLGSREPVALDFKRVLEKPSVPESRWN
jgi:DNA polymerase (family X)